MAGGGDRTGAGTWVSRPEHSDEIIRGNTGRGWDGWCELIDAWPGHADGHAAVATWLQEEHQVPGWWAQSITVGWERITGRRLPGQVADGTFTANRSTTITADAPALAAELRDPDGRAALFAGLEPELRSRPTSKNVRIALVEGVVEVALDPKPDGRVTVTISHTKLGSPEAVSRWKEHWGGWLAARGDG